FLALATVICLAGCTAQNTNITTLQFSADTEPFPSNYQEIAAKAVADRHVAEGETLRVTYPLPLLGQTPFSAKRWYVCVRGLKPERPPTVPSRTNVWNLAESALNPSAETGIYEALIVISSAYAPSVRFVFDAGLCRDVKYGQLVE
ncbi:MAG TPA: hypothetical protein VL147_18425, partial [Devosia sp.]|nr:hypothetical protein [Devosia sp.]